MKSPTSKLQFWVLHSIMKTRISSMDLFPQTSFGGVTMINVSAVTPTVEELAAFDAVLVYSNRSIHGC